VAFIEPIRIQGLTSFSKNLKKLDKGLPKALRVGFNEAADIIVDDAVPKVPRRTGRARKSLKAKSTRTAARAFGGGNRVPYYPWLDFGGEGRRRGRPPARPFIKEGRYLWKSFGDNRDEVAEALEKAMFNVIESSGIEAD
jgi:hypothetical protein